jgi:hypothetical protein
LPLAAFCICRSRYLLLVEEKQHNFFAFFFASFLGLVHTLDKFEGCAEEDVLGRLMDVSG